MSTKILKRSWGYEEVLYNKKGVAFKFIHITSGQQTPAKIYKNKDIAILSMDNNSYITCGAGMWKLDKNQIQQISRGNICSIAAVGGNAVVAELSFTKG